MNIEGSFLRDIPLAAWYGLSVGSILFGFIEVILFLFLFDNCEYSLL